MAPCPSRTCCPRDRSRGENLQPVANLHSVYGHVLKERCSCDGLSRACAVQRFQTEEALCTAKPSRASPPDSMSTTRVPARYSPRITDVKIEMPASKSEPNSPRTIFRKRSTTSGAPPPARQMISGKSCRNTPRVREDDPSTIRINSESAMAAMAIPAIISRLNPPEPIVLFSEIFTESGARRKWKNAGQDSLAGASNITLASQISRQIRCRSRARTRRDAAAGEWHRLPSRACTRSRC